MGWRRNIWGTPTQLEYRWKLNWKPLEQFWTPALGFPPPKGLNRPEFTRSKDAH